MRRSKRAAAAVAVLCSMLSSAPLLAQGYVADPGFDSIFMGMAKLYAGVKKASEPRNAENFALFAAKLKEGAVTVAESRVAGFPGFCYLGLDPEPVLYASRQLVEYHEQGFALPMSLVARQLQWVRAYFENKDRFAGITGIAAMRDVVDIDGYYLLGKFVADYARPAGLKLTRFEEFIADTVAGENFIAMAMPMLLCNANMTNEFAALHGSSIDDPSLDSLLKDIYERYCKDSIAMIRASGGGAFDRFMSLANIRSFYRYSLELLSSRDGRAYTPGNIGDSALASAALIAACASAFEGNEAEFNETLKTIRQNIGFAN